jgi:hypothetical protein
LVGFFPVSRAVDETVKVSYRVEKAGEGGSGGAEYALSAWEECPGGYISYEQTEQSEDGRPRGATE